MKASFILAVFSAGLALAMPTPTTDAEPTAPESYGSEQSVDYKPYKRHIPSEAELNERTADPYNEPPNPYPSGGSYTYKREAVPIAEPEHFEVLTA